MQDSNRRKCRRFADKATSKAFWERVWRICGDQEKLVVKLSVRSAIDHRGSIVITFLTRGSSGKAKGKGSA
ncbi:hypothetical protein OSB04_025130 [Centaurea solstitialis]|uniref:Uncharacterized protein n=1 Tax=Centaurea solstitialis TaxID=347529 RepID=A0AA38T6Y5_9ASTR|nr:hypothetical protein OSB04_025130 [Centaurea solstitialis]